MKLRRPTFRTVLVVVAATLLVVSFLGASLAASEGHGGEDSAQDASKVWDLLARFINFGILAVAIVFLARKPVKNFFSNRSEKIKKEFEELELRRQQAQVQLEEIGKKLAQMEQEREKIIAQFIKEGEAEKERIIESARVLSARIEEQARLTIKQEIQQARQALKYEAAELAVQMAEDLIKRNVKPEDEERLIKHYIEKVVEAA
jgi:F-type H+-transporting ATPase subunit b